jgi:hypothetical protein
VAAIPLAGCSAPAGIDGKLAADDDSDRIFNECLEIVATFVKLPIDRNLEYRTGTIWYYPGKPDREAGERGVQRFPWLGKDGKISRSLKSAGTKGLPIR